MPTPNGSRWRAPSGQTLIGVALCAAILAFAAADLIHTESRLPDAGASCRESDTACRNTELSEQLARDRAAEPLQERYDTRAWLYAFGILAIAALTVAYRLRTTSRRQWLRIFTNLGVAGVWLGIGAVVLLLATDGSSVSPPPAPLLMIPVILLVAAAAGTLMGRSEGWAEQGQANGVREMLMQAGRFAIDVGTAGQVRRSRMEELAEWLSLATRSLTALTCLFALVFVLAQPGCDASASPPDWTNPVDSVAAVTAIGAMAAAVGALVLRRWVVALAGLVICPVAVLFVLASTCAFY
ncbi:MAG TPA: hypothetical protein VLB79_10285 [Solirubrobacterales bacterium]|nr:hypothetical protein [Solirubrobacterales bacterium]